MATETQENEASSLGDEWQWINNETAEVLRATVENAFFADPRRNWSAEELASWIRDVALVSAKKNVWDHAAALGEFLVNGLGYVTGEDYMSMDLALMFTIAEDEAVTQMMNDASLRTVHRYMVGINCWSARRRRRWNRPRLPRGTRVPTIAARSHQDSSEDQPVANCD